MKIIKVVLIGILLVFGNIDFLLHFLIKFSPDESYVAAGSKDGKIFIWDALSTNIQTILSTKEKYCFFFLNIFLIIFN